MSHRHAAARAALVLASMTIGACGSGDGANPAAEAIAQDRPVPLAGAGSTDGGIVIVTVEPVYPRRAVADAGFGSVDQRAGVVELEAAFDDLGARGLLWQRPPLGGTVLPGQGVFLRDVGVLTSYDYRVVPLPTQPQVLETLFAVQAAEGYTWRGNVLGATGPAAVFVRDPRFSGGFDFEALPSADSLPGFEAQLARQGARGARLIGSATFPGNYQRTWYVRSRIGPATIEYLLEDPKEDTRAWRERLAAYEAGGWSMQARIPLGDVAVDVLARANR